MNGGIIEAMTKRYNPTQPIIVGLCGQAGTGKTSVAKGFVPLASATEIMFDDELDDEQQIRIVLDHLFFAMPLYELASIRTKTEGSKSKERMKYAIHDVLADLYGRSPLYGAPRYKDLVELVKWTVKTPIDPDDYKPRSFLQTVGMRCRELNEDCFVQWVDRKIKAASAPFINDGVAHLTFLSDLRMENEAEWVAAQPNGVLVQYTCDDEVRFDRIERRDGEPMTEDQKNHISENEHTKFRKGIFDVVIDSTDLKIKEQAVATTTAINATFGIELF